MKILLAIWLLIGVFNLTSCRTLFQEYRNNGDKDHAAAVACAMVILAGIMIWTFGSML
jgi:hypothetical protein